MPVPRGKKVDVQRRREQVAELYVRGSTQCEIATTLGVSQPTVSLDLKANWKCYDVRESDTLTLGQKQTHNQLNEIDTIANSPGSAWFEPDYDNNGNMIKCPQPAAMGSGFDLKFDGWNRLVQVNNTTGGTLVATYQYDGVSRRIVKFVQSGGTYEHFYYSHASLPVEIRKGTSGSTIPASFDQQYLQGLNGHVILYDRNLLQASLLLTSSSSSSSSAPTQPSRLYLTTDAGWNSTSLVTSAGQGVERYIYNAYMVPYFLSNQCVLHSPNVSSFGILALLPTVAFDAIPGFFMSYHPQLGRKLNTFTPVVSADTVPEEHCCVKSFKPPQGVVEVKLSPVKLGELTTGFQFRGAFSVTAEFEEDPAKGCYCKCCRYMQLVRAWSRIDGEYDHRYGGPDFKEDCIKQNGIEYCYGRRYLPERADPDVVQETFSDLPKGREGQDVRKFGCSYKCDDQPGARLKWEIVRPGAYLMYRAEFRGVIFDLCKALRDTKNRNFPTEQAEIEKRYFVKTAEWEVKGDAEMPDS